MAAALVFFLLLAPGSARAKPVPFERFDPNKVFAASDEAAEAGDDAGALREADRALARVQGEYGAADPRTLRAVGRHGYYARLAGRSELAEADLKRLLAVDPPARESLIEAAHLLRELDRPKEALGVAERAAGLWPRDAEVLDEKGEALVALGRLDEGTAAVARAEEADPRADWLKVRLAELYRMQGRLDDSLKLYEQAGRKAAGEAVSIEEGYAREFSGKPDQAIAEFEALAASSPTDPVPLHHWAQVLEDEGRSKEALSKYLQAARLFREARRFDADYIHTLHHAAGLYGFLGRRREALALLREAIASPAADAPRWRATLPEALLDAGGPAKEAGELASRGLARCAGQCSMIVEGSIMTSLARAAARRGEREQARRWADRALPLAEAFGPADAYDCADRVIVLQRLAALFEWSGSTASAAGAEAAASAGTSCLARRDVKEMLLMSRAGRRCRSGDAAGAIADLRAARALLEASGDAERVKACDRQLAEWSRVAPGRPPKCPKAAAP